MDRSFLPKPTQKGFSDFDLTFPTLLTIVVNALAFSRVVYVLGIIKSSSKIISGIIISSLKHTNFGIIDHDLSITSLERHYMPLSLSSGLSFPRADCEHRHHTGELRQ